MRTGMFKRLAAPLLAVTFAVAAALPAAALEVDKDEFVIDNAGILSSETEDVIVNLSEALSETCGAQIGVYTVDQVGNSTMEGYAYEVFNAWGLGDDDKDNGVLLLLASGDDDYWAVQGEGLETLLPTTTLSRILYDELEPSWVNKDYDTGTQQTVMALAEELAKIYGVSMDVSAVAEGDFSSLGLPGTSQKGGFPVGAVVLIVVLILAVVLLLATPRFGGPRYRGPRYGGPRAFFFFGPPRGGFGGPGPRPGGRRPGGGPRPGGGSRPGGFRTGGGSTRGGGAGRRG